MLTFKYLIKHRGTDAYRDVGGRKRMEQVFEHTEIIKVKKTNENLWGLPQSWIAIIDMTAYYTETWSLATELFIRTRYSESGIILLDSSAIV